MSKIKKEVRTSQLQLFDYAFQKRYNAVVTLEKVIKSRKNVDEISSREVAILSEFKDFMHNMKKLNMKSQVVQFTKKGAPRKDLFAKYMFEGPDGLEIINSKEYDELRKNNKQIRVAHNVTGNKYSYISKAHRCIGFVDNPLLIEFNNITKAELDILIKDANLAPFINELFNDVTLEKDLENNLEEDGNAGS